MDADRFKQLQDKSVELFKSQPAGSKNKISLDAIFMALAAENAAPVEREPRTQGVVPGSEAPPADWFLKTLKKVKGKSEPMTIGQFLIQADRFPAKRMDSVNVARWLRELGYNPRRTGGQLIFDL